ncbi:MAG: right-handed parallel beta-helix repeat-containing protein [Clostridia bacterium]|nr:right-handed parallel beta-helix repeat-containing protein [Clostridia bacterium]
MVFYKDFQTTGNHAFNVFNALSYCKEKGEDGIVFEKVVYDFYPEMASEDVMHVSNHDIYGIYRIAFLLKGMKDFTVDGGGATFMFHGCITPFYITKSENITVKNLTIDYSGILLLETIVREVGEDYIDLETESEDGYEIDRGMLYHTDISGTRQPFRAFFVRGANDSMDYLETSRDHWSPSENIYFEKTGEKTIRVKNPGIDVPVGTNLTLRAAYMRQACNIVASHAKDVFVKDVTMLRGYAMGVLAQMTENVTIEGMVVKAGRGHLNSLDADATHFVHCKGLVKVTDSSFSEQLDDALNIHGIFTKIIAKTDDYITVRYMHEEAKGIDIYQAGDAFQTLDPKSLIPNGEYTVVKAEEVNMEITKIYVKGGTASIRVGDVCEDLTWSSDLEFARNRVENNRARGMLVAAKGKVRIHDNYFHTTGVAILFESDGQYWFESGGTSDVVIEKNTFENCKFTHTWGENVIEVLPREVYNEGEFYHQSITIRENTFKGNTAPLVYADNIRSLVIEKNIIEDQKCEKTHEIKNCGSINCDM